MDKRYKRLGDLLVNYSCAVKPGQRVMIAMVEPETYPLVYATYEAAVKAGAYVQVQFLSEALRGSLMRHGTPDQWAWIPEVERFGMEWADVYIGLRGAHNLYEHEGIPAEALAATQRAMGVVSGLRWNHTRWCLVRVPNESFAQQAQTNLETITDMFFDACFLDWEREAAEWRRQAQALNGGRLVHISAPGTELSFSVEGRTWEVFDGRINMPDGEIYTAPVTDSLHGFITFEFPGILGGRQMENIRLEWHEGELTSATAATHQDYLQQIVRSDPGASLIGEFAFGLNPHVDRFCKDILIDEKIGGTIHIALGRAYPECGGTNQSAIHWDIVKDLRQAGTITLDGAVIFKEGKLVI